MNSVNGHNASLNIGSDTRQSQANLQDHTVKEALSVNQCAQPILDKTPSTPQNQSTFDILQATAQASTPLVLVVEDDDPFGDFLDVSNVKTALNGEVDAEEKGSIEIVSHKECNVQENNSDRKIENNAGIAIETNKIIDSNAGNQKSQKSTVLNQKENIVTETSVKHAAAKIEVRTSEAQEAKAVDGVHESIKDLGNIHVDDSQGGIVPASSLTKDELKAKVAEKAFYVISGNHVYMSPEHAQAKGVKLNDTIPIPGPNGTIKHYTVRHLTPEHISAVSSIMNAHIQTLPDTAPAKEKDSKVEEKSHHEIAKPVNHAAQLVPKEPINKDRVIKQIAQGFQGTETRKNERKLIEHGHDLTAAKLREDAKNIEDLKEKNFKISKNDFLNFDLRMHAMRPLTNAVSQLRSQLR